MLLREQREFICIVCPVGCSIDATVYDGELVEARGQACKRGITFVHEELTAPKRMLTTTVQVIGGELPLAPVRSSEELPKEMLLQVVGRLREVVLEAPVAEHEIVIEDVFGTGVDIITSRALPRSGEAGRSPSGGP